MKIQISPTKRVEDAMVIWKEFTPDVDLAIDPLPPYGIKFKPNSIKVIYAFNILGMVEPEQSLELLTGLVKMLEVGGELYIIDQDFEYILRNILGGELSIKEFNRNYRRINYLSKGEVVNLLEQVGFPVKEQLTWNEGLKFEKKMSEFIISAKKNNKQ